ncbi:MAG: hypothetical protein A2001_01445 [Treponema sp. GWC1_61_84]|nr:MAG: hypothetical protein A2001_01445 [Treponema sp. GWC1_61_84]
MAVNANALATFAEAKAAFGYGDDETAKVEDLINTASSSFELHCKRPLAARDFTWILDGTGRRELVLPEYPVNSITRLSIDPTRAFAAASDVAAADYTLRGPSGIVVLFSDVFGDPEEVAVVRVQANAGYASADPARAVLRRACLEYVDWMKTRSSQAGSIGKKGEYSADGVSVSYEIDIPAHVISRIADFIRTAA